MAHGAGGLMDKVLGRNIVKGLCEGLGARGPGKIVDQFICRERKWKLSKREKNCNAVLLPEQPVSEIFRNWGKYEECVQLICNVHMCLKEVSGTDSFYCESFYFFEITLNKSAFEQPLSPW